MLIFQAPTVAYKRHTSPDKCIRALPGLIEAAYSRLPEHSLVRQNVARLKQQAKDLAQMLGEALPPELQDFWEAYAGWFALYSVGPLLVNAQIAQQAAHEAPQENEAWLVESWRSPLWWAWRTDLQLAMKDILAAQGFSVRSRIPTWLHFVREKIVPIWARRQGVAVFKAIQSQLGQLNVATFFSPGDVLFLAAGASAVDFIAHLKPQIEKQRLSAHIIDYDLHSSRERLREHQLPFFSWTAFLQPNDIRKARPLLTQMAQTAPHMASQAKETMQAHMFPGHCEALQWRLLITLLRDYIKQWLLSCAAQRALEILKPKAVCGFHLYNPDIAPLIVAAKRLQIPCLCLQHGVIGPRYLALPYLPYDEMFVFGEYAKEILARAAPELNVSITGHPLYDSGQKPLTPRPEIQSLRRNVRALIVLCTQYNEPSYYQRHHWWMAEVARVCRHLCARLVLKLHPSDTLHNIRLYRQLLSARDDFVVLVPHGKWPLSELLAAADLMITRDSTVVFEANVRQKPVITVNLSEWDEELPYAATGGALGVYKYEDIAPAIEAVLSDATMRRNLASARPHFLRLHLGPLDGQATQRVIAAILHYLAS